MIHDNTHKASLGSTNFKMQRPERSFVATFRPLVHTRGGRYAAQRHALPPFIDGSCRREPDFESPYPSISATCRAGGFAPRLLPGDCVAYLTVKGKYADDRQLGWRLVAVLFVRERFTSHDAAAEWYRGKGIPLPSNCIVENNRPKSFELTNANPPASVKARVSAAANPALAIRLWDATYRCRIARWPTFLACEAEFLNLWSPPQLQEADLHTIFGRVPATLTPPAILREQIEALVHMARRAA